MFVLANMWFQKLMIQFFFNVDKIVYNFISTIYNLLISISRTSIFSQAEIAEFADRIYKLLAVFMIFKVTFSLIMYIVNPDDFSDKNKGVSKLGTNIIISLCLLVLTPYVFTYAYELQTIILEENTLAKLILGDKADSSYLNDAGDEMAYIAISPFFSPNTSISTLYDCSNLVIKDTEGVVKFNPECSGLQNDSNLTNLNDGESLMALTSEDFFTETTLKNYVSGVNSSNFGLTFRADLALATDPENDYFIMDYKYIFSTVVGVVIVLLLLTFCMDIAVRSIKLSFLQLIAPIPIISYVDPKSGKDGMFKKWYQMCFSTYISLFVRLLALYFAIYIISKVAELKMYDLIDGSYQTNKIVAVFIIIGALMFAKQLPKILEGLGIKLDGNGFTLNPLRKIEKDAIGGKMLKKPNDMLAKAGKGIMKAPFSGMATLGKKTIGGIDAARHGKGFKHGWDRTHGSLYNKWNKKLDEWAPDRAEERKNRLKGEENQEARRRRTESGRKMATPINSALDAKARAIIDPKTGKPKYKNASEWKADNYASYAAAKYQLEAPNFRNQEYRDSYSKLSKAKIDASVAHQKSKDLNDKYSAALTGAPQLVDGKYYGNANTAETKAFIAANPDVQIHSMEELQKLRDGADAKAASADSKVENAKREHEDVKLKYRYDAELETAYDEYGKSHDWNYGDDGEGGWDLSKPAANSAEDVADDYEEPEENRENIPSNAGKFEREQLQVQIEGLNRELKEEEDRFSAEKNKINSIIETLKNQLDSSDNKTLNRQLATEIGKYESVLYKLQRDFAQLQSDYMAQIRQLEEQLSELS